MSKSALLAAMFLAFAASAHASLLDKHPAMSDTSRQAKDLDKLYEYPDTPENHWAYEGIAALKSQGLLVGFPSGERARAIRTSFLLAVGFHAAASYTLIQAQQMRELMHQLSIETPNSIEAFENERKLQTFLDRTSNPLFRRALAYIPRGFKRFELTLRSLGVSPESASDLISDINTTLSEIRMVKAGSALVQFSDVSPSNWAARDILELRRLGLLEGYEDNKGRFHFD